MILLLHFCILYRMTRFSLLSFRHDVAASRMEDIMNCTSSCITGLRKTRNQRQGLSIDISLYRQIHRKYLNARRDLGVTSWLMQMWRKSFHWGPGSEKVMSEAGEPRMMDETMLAAQDEKILSCVWRIRRAALGDDATKIRCDVPSRSSMSGPYRLLISYSAWCNGRCLAITMR